MKKIQKRSRMLVFLRDQKGVVMTETMIVIAIVAIVAVGALVIMNPAIQGLFTNVLGKVTNLVNGAMT